MSNVLHWQDIPCFVVEGLDELHCELITIDENPMRVDLSEAQRAYQIAKRKEIYEALHPEIAHGGDRRSSGHGGHLKNPRFTEETSRATGISERSVRRFAQRGVELGEHARRGRRHVTRQRA